MKVEDKIIFYDGECGLCQRSIALLSRWDTHKMLFFAPLNGVTYESHFEVKSDMSTVVYFKSGKLFTQSDALIEVLKTLGGWKSMAVIFKIIPRFIRDTVYRLIASKRKKVSCIILTRDERFLN